MTIRQRITLLVVLMFIALAAIGGYAVYQTRSGAAEVRKVTEGVVPSALASADLVALVKDVQLATMTLVYAPDGNIVAQARDDLQAKEAALRAALQVQATRANSHAQAGLVAQAKEAVDSYVEAIGQTTDMKLAGKNELAQAFLFANVASYRDVLEKIVETLRIEKNREKDAAITVLNGKLATTATAIGAVSGIAIVVLTAIGMLLYRQITRPLTRMQAEMSEIAASQDFTRRVPVGRMDEIGHSVVAFNRMIEKIQENAALLKQKTADIQAMLQNMQQGILTVVGSGTVHEEYSIYLESIFETQDIAGRSLMALVFADTNLGPDALSQVEAAVDACLGQDIINFAFNQHLLATEVEKRMPDGRVKTLDLSWSAITDDSDTILRLMLCVRDVTELRKLAAEASEQRRNLEIIGEILAVSQEKFQHFIESSTSFVHENERIIRQYSQADKRRHCRALPQHAHHQGQRAHVQPAVLDQRGARNGADLPCAARAGQRARVGPGLADGGADARARGHRELRTHQRGEARPQVGTGTRRGRTRRTSGPGAHSREPAGTGSGQPGQPR